MVYVYAKQSELNKHIGENLPSEDIDKTLKDLGMDVKGISDESDPEFKIEITAEKIDMVSAKGIGRAIRYYKGFEENAPKYEISSPQYKVIVEDEYNHPRPKTVAAILRDVPMSEDVLEELINIQEKMHESFGRDRKKAAIGIYPLHNVKFPIKYKSLPPREISFKPLGFSHEITGEDILEEHETGHKYSSLLEGLERYPVFEDAEENILSMPPIINSEETGKVDINHRDLFIECSGHNLYLLDNILKVLVTTFIDIGAKAESVEVDYSSQENYILNLSNSKDVISLEYINSLLGINIGEEEAKTLLNKMMYGVDKIEDGQIHLQIPVFRQDVWNDCDIADDVARAYGYNNIILNFPNVASVGEELDYTKFRERITESMVSMGFVELYTYMLSSTTLQYKNMSMSSDQEDFINLTDSEDEGINMMRKRILPDNLEALAINRKHKYPQKVFENGFTIHPDESKETKARDDAHLSVSIADPKANYTDIKRVLDTLGQFNDIDFQVEENRFPYFIEGRSGKIIVEGEEVGCIGEIHPQVLENFGFIVPIASMEIDLEKLWTLM